MKYNSPSVYLLRGAIFLNFVVAQTWALSNLGIFEKYLDFVLFGKKDKFIT
jgi:hypothetical protein